MKLTYFAVTELVRGKVKVWTPELGFRSHALNALLLL